MPEEQVLNLENSLNSRRESVSKHINAILADHSKHYNPDEPNIESATDEESIKKYLNDMVDYCATQYDLTQGIYRYINEDSLIRDARRQGDNHLYSENNSISEEADNWAEKIQFYNEIRAAFAFMEYHGHKTTLEDILNIGKFGIVDWIQHTLSQDKTINIQQTEITPEKITESIGKLIHYTGLMDTHYNISTLMKTRDDKEFVVSSVKLQGFNEAVKSRLETLSKDPIETIDDFIAKKSSELILNSKELKVIPTQFSKLVPGLRNAYEESAYKVRNMGIESLLFTGYRSGSPAFLGDDSEKNTMEAVNTFNEQVGGNKVFLNSLMTAFTTAPDEVAAHQLIDGITDNNKNILKAYTPVNLVKWFQEKDVTAFEEILNTVNNQKHRIAADKNQKVQKAFKNITALQTMERRSYNFSAAMRQLIHDIKRGCLKPFFSQKERSDIPDVLLFCKSGKDRTGVESIINLDNVIGKGNEKVTVNSGHQQILTGMNGGTPGAYGTKGTISIGITTMDPSQMPSVYLKLGLSRDTSMGNIFDPKKHKKKGGPKVTDPMSVKAQKKEKRTTKNAPIRAREKKVSDALYHVLWKDGTVKEFIIENNTGATLNSLIEESLLAYDKEQGITRYIQDDCLIRDARAQIIPENNSHEAHAWKAQCYNFCRAAKLVLEYKGVKNPIIPENIIAAIRDKAANKESADSIKRDIIWFIANQLGEKINKKTYDALSKQMNVAINCSTLDDKSYNISTIMKIPEKTKTSPIRGNVTIKEKIIIQSDIKVKGFDDELLQVFRTIANSTKDPVPEGDLYNWYHNHGDFKKFIAKKACQKIVAEHEKGNVPVIPNQLRDVIPGLKNAYLEKVEVKNDNGKDFELDLVSSGYRASVPAYKEDVALTQKTIEAFKIDAGYDQVYLTSLLTANEKKAHSTLKKALGEGDGLIELPLNKTRNLGLRNIEEFDKVLKDLAVILQANGAIGEETFNFISSKRSSVGKSSTINKVKEEIESQYITDKEKKDLISPILNLVECRELMNKKINWRRPGSLDNNKLANKIQIAMHDIESGLFYGYCKKSDLASKGLLTFCKSGKDRTGTTFASLMDSLLSMSLGKNIEDIRDVTIKGGQQALIAGGSGGTTGALGVKNAGGLHAHKRHLKELVNDIGTYGNSSPKYDSKRAPKQKNSFATENQLETIFNFNFNNLLPRYENPLNIFKPKSNINSSELFNITEEELKDDMSALIYENTKDKKTYISSIYNFIAYPFNRLTTTTLNTKPIDGYDERIPYQPEPQKPEGGKIEQLSSSISPENIDPAAKQTYTNTMNELKNKFKTNPPVNSQELKNNPSPVVLRKKELNNVITKFLNKGITRHNPLYPKEINLENLIDYHTTEYDVKQGIIRYIEGDNLIRDARNQNIPEDNSHEADAWKAQCYNFCRAAELVLSHNNHNYRKQVLMGQIEAVTKVTNKESADSFKRKLVLFIAEQNGQDNTKKAYKQISEQLDTAINCTVIDDKSYNVATVMNVNNQTIIQSDVKVKGFNEELFSVFKTIAAHDENTTLEGELYEWYNKHDGFNQFIARKACKKIVEVCTKNPAYFPVIPNQLRAIIPGLKNAYLESVDVIDGDNIKPIMQSYRSTLPAYTEDIALTTEALKSFREDTGSKKIYLNSLVTGNEQKGHSTLAKIKGDDVQLIQSPLNVLRNIGTRDFNSFDIILKEIAHSLGDVITPEAKAFIETNRKLPGQSLTLKKIKNNLVKDNVNDDVKKAIEILVECRELINRKVRWRLYGSLDNNKLANKIQMVMHDIQNGALKNYSTGQLKNTEILTFCKSGKDRTGTVFQGLIDQALMRLFGNDKEAGIIDATIKGGQQAYLAGAGGGTTAAFGIKNDGGLHSRREYVKHMPTALATYGNRTPKYKKEILENDDFDNIDIDETSQSNDEWSSLTDDSSVSTEEEETQSEINPSTITTPRGQGVSFTYDSQTFSDSDDENSTQSSGNEKSKKHTLNEKNYFATLTPGFDLNTRNDFNSKTGYKIDSDSESISSSLSNTTKNSYPDEELPKEEAASITTSRKPSPNNINRNIPYNTITPTIPPIPQQDNHTQQQTPLQTPLQTPHQPEMQNQQPQYQQQYQSQNNRPPSPRSISDYDDEYDYDDFDRYTPHPPMPYYNTPPAAPSPGLTTNQLVMSIIFCLALTVFFGGLGLILGIGISAAVIEISQPAVSIPTPPPVHDYRDRGRGRGRGREREHDIEYTQTALSDKHHIQTPENNAKEKPGTKSTVHANKIKEQRGGETIQNRNP